MRKLSLFIFMFITFSLFLVNVKASNDHEFTCKYINKNNDNNEYIITFRIIGNRVNVQDCKRNGFSCIGDLYQHSFDDVEAGTTDCPSSINVTKTDNITKIEGVEKSKGEYVNSDQFDCIYAFPSSDHGFTDFLQLNIGYWGNQYVIRKAFYYQMSDGYYLELIGNPVFNPEQYLYLYSTGTEMNVIDSLDIQNDKQELKMTCPGLSISSTKDETGKISFSIDFNKKNFFETAQIIKSTRIKNKTSLSELDNSNNCLDFTNESDCISSNDVACVWNKTKNGKGYCNVDKLLYVKCGDIFDIPYEVPSLISFAVNLLKIATPIILIIVSIITLLKAISASNEDEIKKAQKGLIRKVMAAVMVFFVISIVQFVVMKMADNTEKSKVNEETEADNLSTCLSCFLNNKCEGNTYYKTNILGKYECRYINNYDEPFDCS